MHNLVSNDARSFVQGYSSSRTEVAIAYAPSTDGSIDSMSRGLSSKNTTNHRRSSIEEIPIEEYDVLTQFSPMMVRLHGIYINKGALKMHLAKFAITNHFSYIFRTSHKECLHVVCLDDNCGWIVRATKVK